MTRSETRTCWCMKTRVSNDSWVWEPEFNSYNFSDDESINMDAKSESSDDDIFNEFEGDEENQEESPKKTNGTAATKDSESGDDDDEEMDYSD